MIKFIKRAVAKYIAKNGYGLLNQWRKAQLKRIRSFPNTAIASNISLADGSSFVIEGKFKQLVIKQDVFFRKFCNILLFPDATLIIGENVFFNNYCSINCLGYIEIGAHTLFGEGVKIYDHNHRYQYGKNGNLMVDRKHFTIGQVRIGKNCWIGSNVTILNNVEIGDNVIIGANCLVYKSIPSNSIVKHNEDLIITQNLQTIER